MSPLLEWGLCSQPHLLLALVWPPLAPSAHTPAHLPRRGGKL